MGSRPFISTGGHGTALDPLRSLGFGGRVVTPLHPKSCGAPRILNRPWVSFIVFANCLGLWQDHHVKLDLANVNTLDEGG